MVAGTVLGLSPLVPQHWLGSLVAGVATGSLVFVVALRRSADWADPGVEARPAFSVPVASAIGLALWAALFAPTWYWLYQQWTGSLWSNQHGIFVPFAVAYLAHQTLRDDPDGEREESSPWGYVWLVLGAIAALLDAGVQSGYLGTVGLLVSLPGVSLLMLGRRRTRALAVPFAIALLMLPFPRTLATEMQLREVTAIGAEWILHSFGVTALREATVLHLPGRTFVVSDACSGFSTLYAGVAVAFIMAAASSSHSRRLALVAAAPLLAVVANTIRVLLLIVLTQRFGTWVIDSWFHPATGVATFLIVISGLWLVGGRFAPRASLA